MMKIAFSQWSLDTVLNEHRIIPFVYIFCYLFVCFKDTGCVELSTKVFFFFFVLFLYMNYASKGFRPSSQVSLKIQTLTFILMWSVCAVITHDMTQQLFDNWLQSIFPTCLIQQADCFEVFLSERTDCVLGVCFMLHHFSGFWQNC